MERWRKEKMGGWMEKWRDKKRNEWKNGRIKDGDIYGWMER